MTSWWDLMKLWAYLKKGQQDTSRSQQKSSEHSLFVFCFAFFLIFQFFSNSFCFFFFLPKCQISLARDAQRRIAEPQILRWMTQAENPKCIEMHYPSLSQSIPIYPSGIGFCAMSAMSAMSCENVLWLLRAHLLMAKCRRQCCQYMSIWEWFLVQIEVQHVLYIIICHTKQWEMYFTSLESPRNVLSCPWFGLWTMPFTWTFLRFSISWTRLTRQWFCEYRSRTFIVLIWVCCKDIVAQAPNSCVIQQGSFNTVCFSRSNRDILCWRCCQRVIHKHLTFAV